MIKGEAMSDQESEKSSTSKITVLAVNIEHGRVIIPDVMVAEIVDFQNTVTETDDVPTWYLGKLPWRDIEIPLISFEAMNSDSFFSKNRSLKIIVIHAVSSRDKMPYWGFVVNETPKMFRLLSDGIRRADTDESGEVEVMRAEISGEVFIVPDMERIEQNILAELER